MNENAEHQPLDPETRVDEVISPKTVDALALVMAHEGLSRAEALRRLVGYGELVYRTARLEGGTVLLRPVGDDMERTVWLDPDGDPLYREVAALVWMRPTWSTVACAFPGYEVNLGLDPLEPISRCDRWAVDDLVQDDEANRCPACLRAAKRWRAR